MGTLIDRVHRELSEAEIGVIGSVNNLVVD